MKKQTLCVHIHLDVYSIYILHIAKVRWENNLNTRSLNTHTLYKTQKVLFCFSSVFLFLFLNILLPHANETTLFLWFVVCNVMVRAILCREQDREKTLCFLYEYS